MHSSSIDVLFKGSHSALSTSSSKLLPSMLWPLRCQDTGVSGVSASTTRLLTVPFPPGAPLEKDPAMKKDTQGQQGWGNQHRHLQQHPVTRGSSPSCPLYITRAGKFASSISQTPAISPPAEGPMCAGTVSRTTQLQSVILQAQSPLNLDSFQCYLACHPDRQWSQGLLQGIHKGVDIGYQGKRKTVWSGN